MRYDISEDNLKEDREDIVLLADVTGIDVIQALRFEACICLEAVPEMIGQIGEEDGIGPLPATLPIVRFR